jgi:glycosyltransferase involved in cell wall biosynthesis
MTASAASAQPPDIKMSICIATFNRASFIGETLDSILSQGSSAVEIVILDGGSTDDTQQVVAAYTQRFERVRYIRQDTNQGVDRDFNSVVEHARGEYCWLMSDDDFLKPGAVPLVLAELERGYGLIVVNAEVKDSQMAAVLQASRLDIRSDRTYEADEMDRLFAEAGDYLTFIACVVIKRSIWLERAKEPFYGSLFIHVGVIFQAALPLRALVIAAPLISIRYGNAMWRPKEFEIWMFKWPTLVWSLPTLSDATKASVCRREPWKSVKVLLLYRAKGTYSLTEYAHWVRPRLRSLGAKLLPAAVALLPGTLANGLALLYYRLAGRQSGMGMLDMKKSRFYLGNRRSLQRGA